MLGVRTIDFFLTAPQTLRAANLSKRLHGQTVTDREALVHTLSLPDSSKMQMYGEAMREATVKINVFKMLFDISFLCEQQY